MKKEIPVEKNKYYDVKIEGLTHDGLGVARVQGFPIFIANTLPEEEITFKVTLVKKKFAFGRPVDFHVTSPRRVTPPCEIYNQCGGCQLQHLNYKGQLQAKKELVMNNMARIGHLEDLNVQDTLGMEEPWRYRNKTQVPFGKANGEVVAGFYQKRSHEIMNMKSCLIQTEISDQIVETMRQLCLNLGIDPYEEVSQSGVLRHVIIRVGFKTDEVMVVIVTRTEKLPYKDQVIKALLSRYPQIKSIAHNVNPKATNVIFGEKTEIMWGEPYIYDELNGIRFGISPRSFYQVNPVQTEVLYSKTVEFADLTGEEIVFDAYCGIGSITLFLAQHAKQVYGVEIVPEAIADAKMNAQLNGFDNAQFEVGKSEDVIPRWIEEGIIPDVIVVDPPRKGCDKTLLDTILEASPKRIVYVSCDSSTLARDVKILVEGGYQVEVVQPVDLFPSTTHVEVVVRLVIKDKK